MFFGRGTVSPLGLVATGGGHRVAGGGVFDASLVGAGISVGDGDRRAGRRRCRAGGLARVRDH
jgi:hypothetical protein